MRSEIRRFLEALFVEKPSDLHLLIFTLPEKRSYWFKNVEEAICFVESLHDVNVYVGVGLSAENWGSGNRCPSKEIVGIVGLWVDIDFRSDAHPGSALPDTVEEALAILPPEIPPTFVIRTGNGVHLWWVFREPWIFERDEDRQQAAVLAKRWNTLIRDNGRIKGWRIDRLKDLARLLRIPGTMNCKDVANPKPVIIHSASDSRYNPTDLAEYLDDQGVPADDAEEAEGREWSKQFHDKPLTIDLAAEIPKVKLDEWIKSDSRFEKTWFRQRTDMKDQSQSGYDLALADFGYRMNLSEQQIVDLLVHHRRIYHQKPRTKLDYFYRTLSTAAKHRENTFRSLPCPKSSSFADQMDAEAGTASQNPSSGQQPRSDREKTALCKKISIALGVEILRIVKVSGDTPLYRMDLAEGSISFPSVDRLISKSAVRNAVAGKVGILIPDIKPAAWRILVQAMLDACIVEDGGEELESQGAARLCIRQYLAETSFIPSIAGQLPQDLRKPMVRADQIAICASDLQLWANKARSQAISMPALVAMLSAVGAKVERVRGKNFKEQSRRMLPRDEFDPAEYISTVPEGSPEHA